MRSLMSPLLACLPLALKARVEAALRTLLPQSPLDAKAARPLNPGRAALTGSAPW